jgi:hypothetical protein
MGAVGSIPEDRKAELGGSAVLAFRRAAEMFEIDPEGVLIMMRCILTETDAAGQTLAQYLTAEQDQ